MKPELKYIELKSGYGDNGPAWIGMAEFSKSGRTVYFNGKAFKNSNAQGIAGNYYDIENGDEYWISGIKKNGEDRHRYGKGKIMIDKLVVKKYLDLVDFEDLSESKYEIVEISKTDKSKFTILENEKLKIEFDFDSLSNKETHKFSDEELKFMIEECIQLEKDALYNKERRSIKQYLFELEEEYNRRNN